MILNTIKDKVVVYHNLRNRMSYSLWYNEYTECAIDVPVILSRDEIATLILKEIWCTQEDINTMENNKNPSIQDKIDLLRFKNNINYLINYEL